MKSILNKFFPDHDAGTASAILFFLASAILFTAITISDYCRNSYVDSYQVGVIGIFILLGASIHIFGKKR